MTQFFGKDRNIIGVAVTGSLARLESARDIDLVIFHNGAFRDGFAHHPIRCSEEEYQYDNSDLDFSLVPNFKDIIQIKENMPLDLIFVHENILWDCVYLRLLGKSEKFPEFYKRVFCDLPLLLMGVRRDSSLEKFAEKLPISWLEIDSDLLYPSCKVTHACQNPACKPAVAWEQLRAEIEKRKAKI